MKTLAEFTKTTLIGGILIILPIYIAVLLLAKAVKALLEMLSPVTAQLPGRGGAEGARARQPRQRDCAAKGNPSPVDGMLIRIESERMLLTQAGFPDFATWRSRQIH